MPWDQNDRANDMVNDRAEEFVFVHKPEPEDERNPWLDPS